jgi:hypothetical protein
MTVESERRINGRPDIERKQQREDLERTWLERPKAPEQGDKASPSVVKPSRSNA